jgi:hypothetical protein
MVKAVSKIIFFMLIINISACGYKKGQTVYNWERTYGNIDRFSIDHQECLKGSDSFPYKIPNPFDRAERANTRAKWGDYRGIWASYVPYKGAQPIMIKYDKNSWLVDNDKYTDCMLARGYHQREYRNWHPAMEIKNRKNASVPIDGRLYDKEYKE